MRGVSRPARLKEGRYPCGSVHHSRLSHLCLSAFAGLPASPQPALTSWRAHGLAATRRFSRLFIASSTVRAFAQKSEDLQRSVAGPRPKPTSPQPARVAHSEITCSGWTIQGAAANQRYVNNIPAAMSRLPAGNGRGIGAGASELTALSVLTSANADVAPRFPLFPFFEGKSSWVRGTLRRGGVARSPCRPSTDAAVQAIERIEILQTVRPRATGLGCIAWSG